MSDARFKPIPFLGNRSGLAIDAELIKKLTQGNIKQLAQVLPMESLFEEPFRVLRNLQTADQNKDGLLNLEEAKSYNKDEKKFSGLLSKSFQHNLELTPIDPNLIPDARPGLQDLLNK